MDPTPVEATCPECKKEVGGVKHDRLVDGESMVCTEINPHPNCNGGGRILL